MPTLGTWPPIGPVVERGVVARYDGAYTRRHVLNRVQQLSPRRHRKTRDQTETACPSLNLPESAVALAFSVENEMGALQLCHVYGARGL